MLLPRDINLYFVITTFHQKCGYNKQEEAETGFVADVLVDRFSENQVKPLFLWEPLFEFSSSSLRLLDIMVSALFLQSIPVLPFVTLVPISLKCSSSYYVPFSHWSFCATLDQCGMEWRMVCTRRCRRLGKKTRLAK